jgi:hypothetical protein
LCAASQRTGDDEAARSWGRKAIDEKTRRAEQTATKHKLGKPRKRGRRIIAFSLWGNNPRYLRGALHNQLVAARLYPGFTCRFYVDSSVPADLLAALELNGAELVHDEAEPTQRRRLTRRFHVADDPAVAVHLVRDCDSVLNPREAGAVTQWLESGKPIHVMRDWWTHTDPMLAGMWGGLGGVLPPLEPLLAAYNPRVMETANWDQWFLRDRIWALVRPVAMVHDRLFGSEGSQPFPGPQPTGNVHVGQDEYAVRRDKQAGKLALFKASVPSLEL